eukprot:g8277.t1
MQDLSSSHLFSHHRNLLQNEYRNNRSESHEHNLVGLAVLVAVAVLFLLNICLCVWKLLPTDDNERNPSSGRNRHRLTRSNPNSRSLPVIFINPGGSLRIGQKSKHGTESSEIERAHSLPDTTDRYYYFDEVELESFSNDDSISRSGSMELTQINRSISG